MKHLSASAGTGHHSRPLDACILDHIELAGPAGLGPLADANDPVRRKSE